MRRHYASTTITLAALIGIGVTGCSSSDPNGSTSATSTRSSRTTSSSAPPSTRPTTAAGTSGWPTIAPGGRMPPPQTSETSGSASPAPPAPGAPVRARVKAFVATIVTTTGVTRDGWATKLAAFTDTDLAQRLALTDPANIPAQKVTGEPQLLYTSTAEAVSGWFVPTSTIGYTVISSQGGGQLQLVGVEPGRVMPPKAVATDSD